MLSAWRRIARPRLSQQSVGADVAAVRLVPGVQAKPAGSEGEIQGSRPVPGITDEELLQQCEVHGLRKGGPGGQRRNKAETGIRLVHTSTGVRAEAHDERSQASNKQHALKKLRKNIAISMRKAVPLDAQNLLLDITRLDEVEKKALDNVVMRKVGPKNNKFADGVAPLLDVLSATEGALGDAATALQVSTGSLSKTICSDKELLESANAIRQLHGLKPLRCSK